MILSTVEYCPNCRLSFYYPIELLDDFGKLRVIGQPLDKCPQCGLCEDCHKRQGAVVPIDNDCPLRHISSFRD